MQPRQRSKCSTTVRFSAIVPSSRASIRWMRPRGESISSLQSRYVGHVGRQKPQCTQSSTCSRITRRGSPAGRTPPEALVERGEGRRRTFVQHGVAWAVRDARARAHDRARLERRQPRGELTGREADDASSGGLPRAALVPDLVARLAAADERTRRSRSAPSTAASPPSKSTATRPGGRTSSALGTSCERRSAATTRGRVVRLDHQRPRRAPGSGAAGARPARSAPACRASRRRACRGRSRRRSSPPCRPRSRPCRPRARA